MWAHTETTIMDIRRAQSTFAFCMISDASSWKAHSDYTTRFKRVQKMLEQTCTGFRQRFAFHYIHVSYANAMECVFFEKIGCR